MTPKDLSSFAKEIAGLTPEERRARIRREILVQLEAEDVNSVAPWFKEAAKHAFSSLREKAEKLEQHTTASLLSLDSPGDEHFEQHTPHPLNRIRCRAERRLLDELHRRHHLDHYLQLASTQSTRQNVRTREAWAAKGAQIDALTAPRLFSILSRCLKALDANIRCEVVLIPDARCAVHVTPLDEGERWPTALLEVSSAALEKLTDSELAFVLSHELAHCLLPDALHMDGLFTLLETSGHLSNLPPMSEAILLRWRKKRELTMDRIALVACGDFQAAKSAIVRAEWDVDSQNIVIDPDLLFQRLVEQLDKSQVGKFSRASHPLVPLRLKALQCFAKSELAKDAGFSGGFPTTLDTNQLEEAVENCLSAIRRHPTGKPAADMMTLVAMGGAKILCADSMIGEHEIRILMHILLDHFTDTPEEVLMGTTTVEGEAPVSLQLQEIEALLETSQSAVATDCTADQKRFIIRRLAEIAVADGRLMRPESGIIQAIATNIGISSEEAQDIIVRTADLFQMGQDPVEDHFKDVFRAFR